MATLSVLYITRNDEAFLPTSMASIAPIADEIIVIDTGSADGTGHVARQFRKTKVITHAWVHDFSKIRNFGLVQCTQDWVLYLDSDEFLDEKSASLVKSSINEPRTAQGFALHILDHERDWDARDAGRPSFFPSPQVRLFRRRPDIIFEGRVMESVRPTTERAGSIDVLNARIHHFLWRGKGAEYAGLKIDYYRKLGATLPDFSATTGTTREAGMAQEGTSRAKTDVAVVIPAHNALGHTKQCVQSIIKNTTTPVDLVLVDNGSTDGTASFMRDMCSREPLSFRRNEGAAKAKNAGALVAMKNPDLKYVCFVDNDVVVSPGWVEAMSLLMDQNAQLGAIGPITNNGPAAQNVSSQYQALDAESMGQRLPERSPELLRAEEIGGFCMLVRTEVLKKVGLFDESFGLYGYDDADLCRRIRGAGHEIGIANRAYVIHRGAATLKANPAVNWHSVMLTSSAKYKAKWNLTEVVWPLRSAGGSPSLSASMPSSPSQRVSIVVIGHNRLDMTKVCLESVAKNTANYELIFVDNASTDGTSEYVRSIPGAKVITNVANKGVPKARNQGIRASTAPWVVLMDNDIEVKKGWLEELLAAAGDKIDMVGIEGWQINADFCASHKCVTAGERVDYLGGACTLFRRRVFEVAGLLDEGFSPAYYEDSLAGDRLVPVRIANAIDVMSLEELFKKGRQVKRDDGREETILDSVEVLSVDPASPCPPLSMDDLPTWWKNRFLSEMERRSYEAAMSGNVGREFIDYIKTRIKKRIRRSLGEEAAGTWRRATKVIRHKTRKALYRIDSKHGQTVCTGDHSIMCWNGNKLVETKPKDVGRLCSVSLPVECEERTFAELPVDGVPDSSGWVRFHNPLGHDYSLPKLLRYNSREGSAFFKLLGYYASEGSYSNGHCSISVYDEELANKIRDAASMSLRRPIKIYKYAVDNSERTIRGRTFRTTSPWCYRIIIGNKKIARLMADLCGIGHENKRVPAMVLNATEARKLDFLGAILDGDAYRYDLGRSRHEALYSREYKDKAFRFCSTSMRLASGLCLLLSTLGKRYSVSYCDEKKSWQVDFIQFRKNSRTKIKVSNVGKANGYVYDISVDGTQTFVDAMGMLVVHNTEMSMRAKDRGLKIHWLPSKLIIHREHSTLIHGQKTFPYQEALAKSQEYFARKRRGQVEVKDELLPPVFRKPRILYLGMQYDYGVTERGTSFEHDNFYPALKDWDRTKELIHFDFVALGKQHGIAKMSDMLLEAVYQHAPDVVFAIFFDQNHDPRREALSKISRTTPTKTIGWFCDSHWRYESFDKPWTEHLDFSVTTSASAYNQYIRDGLGAKVIKSQWAAAPGYRRISEVIRDIDVSFVGQPHGDRRQVIDNLRRGGIRVEVFGTGWGKRLTFDEMIATFNRSKINLNLSNASDARFKQIKGRNFEVPGCGGFLLTELAENLADYYVPGKEIGIYSSTSDMSDAIRHYLANDQEREAVAAAAYQRTMSEHTYAIRFNSIFSRAGLV
jgi:spore maturation protein CgeB